MVLKYESLMSQVSRRAALKDTERIVRFFDAKKFLQLAKNGEQFSLPECVSAVRVFAGKTRRSLTAQRFNGKYLQLYRFNNPEIEISRHNISFMKPHLELVLQDGRKVQFVLPEALDDVDKMQRELRQHLSQIDSNLDDLENNLPENWVLNADMTPEVPPPEKLEEMRQHRLKTLEKQKEQRKRLLAEEAKKAAEMEELQKLRAEEEARLAQEAALEKARKQREQLDAAVQQRRAAREVE